MVDPLLNYIQSKILIGDKGEQTVSPLALFKESLNLFSSIINRSSVKIGQESINKMILIASEKLGEAKHTKSIQDFLVRLAERASPKYILQTIIQ